MRTGWHVKGCVLSETDPQIAAPSRDAQVIVEYGCYDCLRGHEGPLGVIECPWCGGLTGTMPADEQPTVAARRAVAWEERTALAEQQRENDGNLDHGIGDRP